GALRDVALRLVARRQVDVAEREIEVADVVALREETADAVGEPEDLQVGAERLVVHRLAAVEAVSGGVQPDGLTGGQRQVVGDGFRYRYGCVDGGEPVEGAPVAVDLEEDLPALDVAAPR